VNPQTALAAAKINGWSPWGGIEADVALVAFWRDEIDGAPRMKLADFVGRAVLLIVYVAGHSRAGMSHIRKF
jgi:hypothetical protein